MIEWVFSSSGDSEILSRLRRHTVYPNHELKPINIVLSYTMPWPNINNLTKYCVMIVHGKDSVIELYLSFVLLFFLKSHLLWSFDLFLSYCILLAIWLPFVNKLELSWVEEKCHFRTWKWWNLRKKGCDCFPNLGLNVVCLKL